MLSCTMTLEQRFFSPSFLCTMLVETASPLYTNACTASLLALGYLLRIQHHWLLHVQEAVSKYGSSTAIKLYVGKRGGKQSIKQPEIDQLLVRYCLQVPI